MAHTLTSKKPEYDVKFGRRDESRAGILLPPNSQRNHRPPVSRISRKYRSKEVLFNEGDEAQIVYEVIDGTVMLYTISEDGRRTVIGFMQKGDYFGFVTRNVHSYFAQTTGACVIRSIPRVQLLREIREHHRAAEKFLALESNALENARRHISLLTRKSSIERVAMFLRDMACRQGGGGDSSTLLELPMTRSDIADYLGLVVETVCRCLTHLREDGAIDVATRGRIQILDREILRRFANGEEDCCLPGDVVAFGRANRNWPTSDTGIDLIEGLRSGFVAY